MNKIFFLQFFTGSSGDLPIVIANIAERRRQPQSVVVGWFVESGDTGWKCSHHGRKECEHSEQIIEVLPENLAKYLLVLEDKADDRGLTPQRRSLPAEARRGGLI